MTTAAPAAVVIPAALTAEAREAAAPTMEVPEEAAIPAVPEETAAPAAEVTWIWSGHRICCSPVHAIDIYILRVP